MDKHDLCVYCGRHAEFTPIGNAGAGYVRCTNMDCRMETPITAKEADAWAIWERRVEV